MRGGVLLGGGLERMHGVRGGGLLGGGLERVRVVPHGVLFGRHGRDHTLRLRELHGGQVFDLGVCGQQLIGMRGVPRRELHRHQRLDWLHAVPGGGFLRRGRGHQLVGVPAVCVWAVLWHSRRDRRGFLRGLPRGVLFRSRRRERGLFLHELFHREVLHHRGGERGVDVHQLHRGAVLDGCRDELVGRLRGLPDGQL